MELMESKCKHWIKLVMNVVAAFASHQFHKLFIYLRSYKIIQSKWIGWNECRNQFIIYFCCPCISFRHSLACISFLSCSQLNLLHSMLPLPAVPHLFFLHSLAHSKKDKLLSCCSQFLQSFQFEIISEFNVWMEWTKRNKLWNEVQVNAATI